MKTRSWSWSVGIMLVPSTLTGWYRKMIKNAETASEMSTSRSQPERRELTRRGCAGKADALSSEVGSIAWLDGLPTSIVSTPRERKCVNFGYLRRSTRIPGRDSEDRRHEQACFACAHCFGHRSLLCPGRSRARIQ